MGKIPDVIIPKNSTKYLLCDVTVRDSLSNLHVCIRYVYLNIPAVGEAEDIHRK